MVMERGRTAVGAALVSAMLVAGAGGAVAGSLVTSKTIKNDTIKPVDLNFVVGQNATTRTTPVTLGLTKQSVMQTSVKVNDGGGLGTAYAVVQVTNPTGKAVDVSLVLTHVQDTDHTQTFTTEVLGNSSMSLVASFQCNFLPAGKQTVDLSVTGPEVVVEHGILTMVATPRI